MTNEEKELLSKVLKYTYASGDKLKNIRYFIKNYIDDKMHVCGHCKAQIRFAHKRVIKWFERNKAEIFPEENTQSENTRTCKNCNKDIKHLDKRKKYCSNDCKVEYKNK